jgi:putative N6-adenine-specific DNA methylase
MEELASLGVTAEAAAGGAKLEGDTQLVMRLCLLLGTASSLRIQISQFRCRALGELQRKASQLPWRDWLAGRFPISLQSRSYRSRVYHTGGISERIYNAIGTAFGQAPMLAKEGDEIVANINARFSEDVCTISLEATSTPLHRRGYRLDARKAPLREDIAHALILASKWSGETAFLDPFCGSGTIAIEAACIASGLAPGRLRAPALQQTTRFDIDAWQRLLAEVESREVSIPIHASDRDDGAVKATRANAERAGVGKLITCEPHALAAQPWFESDNAPPKGSVVTNPPFGLRVRGDKNLLPLYQTLGHRIRGLGDGWNATILSNDKRLVHRTGLELEHAFTTKHGGLAVTAMRPASNAQE